MQYKIISSPTQCADTTNNEARCISHTKRKYTTINTTLLENHNFSPFLPTYIPYIHESHRNLMKSNAGIGRNTSEIQPTPLVQAPGPSPIGTMLRSGSRSFEQSRIDASTIREHCASAYLLACLLACLLVKVCDEYRTHSLMSIFARIGHKLVEKLYRQTGD